MLVTFTPAPNSSPVEPPVHSGEQEVQEELERVHGEPRHEEGDAEEHVDGGEFAQAQHPSTMRSLAAPACKRPSEVGSG